MWVQLSDEQFNSLHDLFLNHDHNNHWKNNGVSKKFYDAAASRNDKEDNYFRTLAQELHRDGDLEIDEDAVVSVGEDNGAYVQMWKWIEDDRVIEE